jgi:iron complex outermembrane receptor protein
MRTATGLPTKTGRLFGGAALAILALAATAATAQQAPQAAVEEIVVTGSRIARRDFVAPSPIVTTSLESIQASGAVNVESALLELPQFAPGQGQTSNPLGGGGRATLNLRGLGEGRNLVLLDGRRLPPSNALNVVDVNMIPNVLIQSVEVISGGASAVYGSDAMSGVVNFKTRQRMNGFQADGQYKISDQGDAAQYDVSLAGGRDFADGKGSVIFSGGYTHRDELLGKDREFYKFGVRSANFAGGTFNFGANRPTQAAVNQVFARYGVAAGAAPATSAVGVNDDGTLFTLTNGTNAKLPASYGVVSGSLVEFTAPNNTIITPQDRYSGFGRVTYEVAPEVTAYGQVLYTYSKNKGAQNWPTLVPNATVPVTNPFIPAELRSILASRPNPTAPVTLAKRFAETPKRYYINPFKEFQAVAGVRGRLGEDTTFDVYASHGRTTVDEDLTSAVILSRVSNLLNAPDGGRSICAGGYNPFGIANALATSKECVAYITTPLHSEMEVKQNIIEGTISGKLFRLPADDLRYSVTADYRKNTYAFTPDALFLPLPGLTTPDLGNTQASYATTGATSVKEISTELLVPLLKDVAMAQALNLSLGYRYSDYQYGGGVSTYKAETDWTVVRGLLLRGGYEHAIRAPNVGELFSAPTGAQLNLGTPPQGGDPCDFRYTNRTAAVRALCVATGIPAGALEGFSTTSGAVGTTVTGNKGLTPETANTYTAGAVFTPRFSSPWIANLSLSVDYYKIKIEDAISVLPANSVVSKCYNLDGSNPGYDPANAFCALIERDKVGFTVRNINTPYYNLGGYATSGLDMQLDARWALDDLGLGENAGTIILSTVVNRLYDFEIQLLPDQAAQDFVGTVGGGGNFYPRWRGLTTVTYRRGPVDIGVRWKHVARMKDSSTVTSPSSPSPPTAPYDSYDLTARWKVSPKLELRGGIVNALDKDPLVVGGTPGGTNAAIYDIIGRQIYLGARVNF